MSKVKVKQLRWQSLAVNDFPLKMEGQPSYAEKGIKERGKLRDSLQALQANIPEHTKGCGTEACIHLITMVDWEPEKAQCLISTASESSSSHNSVTVLDGVQSQRMTVIDAGSCCWFALGYDIRYLCYWGALSANEWGSSNQLEIVFCARGTHRKNSLHWVENFQ